MIENFANFVKGKSPLPNDPSVLLDFVPSAVLSDVSVRKEKEQRRLSHALRRIKSKGYYAENLPDLLDRSNTLAEDSKSAFYASFFACRILAPSLADVLFTSSLGDELWYMAIDCAMQSLHPDLIHDPNNLFGSYIDADIGTIYMYLFLLAFISFQNEQIEALFEIAADAKREAKNAEPAKKDKDERKLAALLKKQIAEQEEAFRSEKRSLEKSILRLKHELDDARKKADEEIASLKEQNAQLVDFILRCDEIDEEGNEDLEQEEAIEEGHTFQYPLPDSRVLFLGGHRNMTKKVEALHPDWLFLSDDNIRTRGATNIDVIFFWTGHSSHKLQEKVFADLPEIPPIIYVTATNIDRLEQEMLSGYNNLLQK